MVRLALGLAVRQDHPKTSKPRRTVVIPSFTAESVRRQLRHVLDLAGISGVTPHMFRRTVATAISNEAGVELAAELLGHTDPAITLQHYIRRNEMVNPSTAGMLDRVFKKES